MNQVPLERFSSGVPDDFISPPVVPGTDYFEGDENVSHIVLYGDADAASKGIIFVNHAYSVDESWPVQRWRNGLLAGQTGMLVVGLSVPGFNPNLEKDHGVSFSKDQKLALTKHGDWKPFAEQSWERIVPVLDRHSGTSNVIGQTTSHFKAQSMGVSTEAAMLYTRPQEARLGNVIVWEGVNLKQRRFLALARVGLRFGVTGIQAEIIEKPKYKDEWDTRPRPMPGADESFKGNLVSPTTARAIGKGYDTPLLHESLNGNFFNSDVMRAIGRNYSGSDIVDAMRDNPGAVAHLWYEKHSLMDTRKPTIRLANILASAGVSVHLVEGGRAHDAENFILEQLYHTSLALEGKDYSEPVRRAA